MLADSRALHAYRNDMAEIAAARPRYRERARKALARWQSGRRRVPGRRLSTLRHRDRPRISALGHPDGRHHSARQFGTVAGGEKVRPRRGCRLATYAAYWIRAEIRDYVVRAYRVVRLGTTKAERRALRAYRKTRESDPSALAAASGMTPEGRSGCCRCSRAARPASTRARTSTARSADRIAGATPSPEDEAGLHEANGRARDAVAQALGDFTERERVIVRERLMADEPRTLQDLGSTARREQGARAPDRRASARQVARVARGAAR